MEYHFCISEYILRIKFIYNIPIKEYSEIYTYLFPNLINKKYKYYTKGTVELPSKNTKTLASLPFWAKALSMES